MANILITGSSGFIGSNFIHYFKSKKFNIIPISRKIGLDYNSIKPSFLDINNVEIIIHLAGKAHDLRNFNNNEDYFKINTDLTINVFNAFLESKANVFIYFSSVKAVSDCPDMILTEDIIQNPFTAYGKSKFAAEKYILSKLNKLEKRIYILRPCMVHGPANKGNLNLLYNIVSKGLIWPLGLYENKRSFCSIDNLCFIINELIENNQITSGIYNVADDEPLSTNELITLISKYHGKKQKILNVPKFLVKSFSKFGDLLNLPLNTDRLNKLTESYIVSNKKIKQAINKQLPLSTKEGLLKTFHSFNN
jgi:nucleoside-diphosphate-sugar epimerase